MRSSTSIICVTSCLWREERKKWKRKQNPPDKNRTTTVYSITQVIRCVKKLKQGKSPSTGMAKAEGRYATHHVFGAEYDGTIRSSVGLNQGDPVSSFLFAFFVSDLRVPSAVD